MDDLVFDLGTMGLAYGAKHPRAIGWLILLAVVCTVAGAFVSVWSKRAAPEKRAMLMGSFIGRAAVQTFGFFGYDPVRAIDILVNVWKWAWNAVAKARGKELPYPQEPQAIVTSRRGEPVETALVEPQSKRVTTLVPAPMQALEEARADAEAERRAAIGVEETIKP